MRYCVDFESNPTDWISPAGSYELMEGDSFACTRGWVVIESHDFANIYANMSTPQFTEAEVTALKLQAANPSPFNLSVEEGGLVASSILGVWAVAAAIKAIVRFFSGGDSQE
jgi:hypothetical protein